MKKNKYHLTIKHPKLSPHLLDLTLTPPSSRGFCFKCKLKMPIWVISEKYYPYEEKNFCRNCAVGNLDELEESNCEFENKKEVIKEIRKALLETPALFEEEEKELECYG